MNLDLRIPMGLMFSLVGIILAAFGLATNGDAALYAKSLGINANLWWGLVLFVFGLTMLLLGRLSQKRLAKLPPEPVVEGETRRGHCAAGAACRLGGGSAGSCRLLLKAPIGSNGPLQDGGKGRLYDLEAGRDRVVGQGPPGSLGKGPQHSCREDLAREVASRCSRPELQKDRHGPGYQAGEHRGRLGRIVGKALGTAELGNRLCEACRGVLAEAFDHRGEEGLF